MKLRWSPWAVADREGIFDYLAARNPSAALAMDDRIQKVIRGLKAFPEKGRSGRVPSTRELVITDTPYIAAYQIQDGVILILRVLHAAQLWPEDLP
ncbi:type II toxin-antitoxin system mRNA interferase toxin, RelE/StbE family [Azospirillum sp. B4]|uniref:type II toxin-antitoxin system RelE/ParE family toxin n=1 Tax=Azospirillum sp. B4 TaxID=95605 RepID=UPI00034B09A0|nr:type II toxin-antitoxin system mRNA interferase toxin, RelE/StbE family [Azospirillum sp. B4]